MNVLLSFPVCIIYAYKKVENIHFILTMRNSAQLFILILQMGTTGFISACTSPYAARGIPEIPEINSELVSVDMAVVSVSNNAPIDCEFRRNAILLKASYIALANNYDHFEFKLNEDSSRVNYDTIPISSGKGINVYLCRGTCPLMYSADAMSHILVSNFSRPTWNSVLTSRNDEHCSLRAKT